MRAVVKNVAKYFPTAIISGRSRDKVIDMPLFAFINVNVNVMLFLNSWKIWVFLYKRCCWCLCIDYFLFLLVQVYEFVGLAELYYAGSHGMDIMGPVRQSIPNDNADTIQSTGKQVV